MYKSNIRWLRERERERERERTIELSSSLVARWLKGHPLSMSVERAIVTNKRPPPQRSISLSQRRAIRFQTLAMRLSLLFSSVGCSSLSYSPLLFSFALSLSRLFISVASRSPTRPPPPPTTTTHCYCSTEMRQICLI